MTIPPEIEALHKTYCTATGFDLRMDMMRARAWHDFTRGPFTRADLALVIGYLRKEIARGNRNIGALKFSNLIVQIDRFEEDLALAKKSTAIRDRELAVEVPPLITQELPDGTQRRLDDREARETTTAAGDVAAATFAEMRRKAGI